MTSIVWVRKRRATTRNYKDRREIILEDKEHIIVYDTHEPIIQKAVFDRVQSIIGKRCVRTSENRKKLYLFSGMLRCADCGSAMIRNSTFMKGKWYVYHKCRAYNQRGSEACSRSHSITDDTLTALARHTTMTNKNGTRHYYMRCATSKQLGSSACSSHLISENVILDVLAISVNSLVDSFADVERAVRKNANNEINLIRNRLKHQLSKALNEREEIEKSRTKLYHTYTNKLDDMLSDDMYVEMRTRLEKMYKAANENITKLKQDTERLNSDKDFTTEFMQNYSKYQGFTILTRDIIADIVDKILIGRDKAIKIVFKFQDEVKKYASFFENSITDNTLVM